MSPYIGIRDLAIASGFVALTILTSVLVGPGRYNRAKYDHECGIEPTPQPVGGRFLVKYYITAMLFYRFRYRDRVPLSVGCGLRPMGTSRWSR